MDYKKVLEIPTNIEELDSSSFIITSNSVNETTHLFHRYPAKFIPHIPRWGIKFANYKKMLVIDPFCGSGTTNLEAFVSGNYSLGIDIDPLAILISKVKTTLIDTNKLLQAQNKISKNIEKYLPSSRINFPNIDNIDHWFTEDTQKKIAFLKENILEFKDKDIRDFLIITLSSIIREVSNADNQTQKTYVSHTLTKNPPETFNLFKKRLGLYIDRMLELKSRVRGVKVHSPIFIKADSRTELLEHLKNFDGELHRVAITSPPYGKAIDYLYNQMLEYFWFGDLLDIEGRKKFNDYKKEYVGTKQVYSCEYKNYNYKAFNIQMLDDIIEKILRKDEKHAYITYQYFFSMKKNLEVMSKILRKNEYYIMVVGNTFVSGYSINTGLLLSEIAKTIGYELKANYFYKIRNRYMRFDRKGRGGLIEDDNVLVLSRI